MDKFKLGALGERLKTGGAQMSRKVSGKMKEILQVQTQESKMVDEATLDSLEEPNWGINLRICALLNSEELSGPEVVRAIKKKIASKNTVSQRLSLDLLEACAMNCDKVFSEIASEKVLDEMVRMIDNPQTHYSSRQRALQLIQAWGESGDLGYLPVFYQTYVGLKARGIPFSGQDNENLATTFSSMELGVDQQPMPLPEEYPNSNMDAYNMDQIPLADHGFILTSEESKEILVVTRNSIDLLSSMVNPETQQQPVKDDLILSILEKCKQSQPVIQRIIESAGDDEALLFEALNLHDELQQVLSRYGETEAAVQVDGQTQVTPSMSGSSSGYVAAEKEEEKEASTGKEAENLNSPLGESSEASIDSKRNG
ncbi:ENTH/VHS/GAT family protein [Tasmannia lanceolata]|uniref:ENTH/VHS/GAT family protein n=1 Tax=Tasmannia lanceolata TaxID=3420 RepID=UPI0040630BDD